MDSKTSRESNIISLVPKLIRNSKGLTTELKNRIKSNHIFSEFELKASNQLNFFIKESEKRHLGSKYGTKIDYILNASKKRGQKEAYKILNDNFYLDKELAKERKKMLKKSTNEVHDNITDIIKKIKGIQSTKNFWENYSYNKAKNFRKKIKPLNDDILFFKNKKLLDIKKKEINNVFNEEEEKLNKFFTKYKNYLSEVNDLVTNSTEKNLSKRFTQKININIPKMQLLNYTKSFPNIKTKKDIDDENRINMKKLLQYSISKKEIHPQKEKSKNLCLTIPNRKKNNYFFETKNTNNLVFQKAINEWNSFGKNFMLKNDKIKDKLGLDKIPNLKAYENLVKTNFDEEKKRRRYLNEIKYKKQKDMGKNMKELLINKIDENLKLVKNFENILLNLNKKVVSI